MEPKTTQPRSVKEDRRLSKRTRLAMVLILVAIPLAIAAGIFLLDDRRYYLVSMVVILLSMAPFLMVFEHRRPQARELVTIAALVAITVVGRAAFFMLPQIKPVVAMVIVTGLCLGGETGFIVGALTGFISNFFYGQGPWTPWQMFAYGIIGFLAGVLWKKGLPLKKKLPAAIFGFAATMLIYGPLMDIATLFTMSSAVTLPALLAMFGTGLPFNLLHAAGTAGFLLVLVPLLTDKIDRVKQKYGLMEP